MKKAIDVMTKNIITIQTDDSLDKIIKLMQDNSVGRLPVIENEVIVGVVTREDILIKKEKAPLPQVIAFWDVVITLPSDKKFEEKLRKLSAYKAKYIMSARFLTVDENEGLESIVTRILEENYGYALVTKLGKLTGIITKSDLIKKSF